MTLVASALSIICLGGFIWAVVFLLPKARREQDAFAIMCTLLTALLALVGSLFIGSKTHSSALSIVNLAAFVWVVMFLVPRARRQHDALAIVASLLAAFLALVGWLFTGSGVYSP